MGAHSMAGAGGALRRRRAALVGMHPGFLPELRAAVCSTNTNFSFDAALRLETLRHDPPGSADAQDYGFATRRRARTSIRRLAEEALAIITLVVNNVRRYYRA